MSMVEEGAENAPPGAPLEEEEAPSLIDIGYPLRLSKTEKSTVESKTKLNASEFWALQNIWSYIKSRWHRYALELYVEFYTENHEHINKFRNKKSGKICVLIFSEHAKIIFQRFKEIIENGLKNWDKSANLLNDMSKAHVAHGITLEDLDFMAHAFQELILEKCDGIVTPTVVIALKKLWEEAFEKQSANEMLPIDDAAMEIDEDAL